MHYEFTRMPAGYTAPDTTRCQTKPDSTKTTAFKHTGFAANPNEGVFPAMADTTTASAVDPPGGWMHRRLAIKAIANPTANAPATNPGSDTRTTNPPAIAETVCPKITGQGCENGPPGAPKTRTALAPIDAASTEPPTPPTNRTLRSPVIKIPNATPKHGRNIARQPAGFGPIPTIAATR